MAALCGKDRMSKGQGCSLGDWDMPPSVPGAAFPIQPSWFRSPRSLCFRNQALRAHVSPRRYGVSCHFGLINADLNNSASVSDMKRRKLVRLKPANESECYLSMWTDVMVPNSSVLQSHHGGSGLV